MKTLLSQCYYNGAHNLIFSIIIVICILGGRECPAVPGIDIAVEQLKKDYEFESWKETLQFPNKQLMEFPSLERVLHNFGKCDFSKPGSNRRSIYVILTYGEKRTDQVNITLTICRTIVEAKDTLVGSLMTSMMSPAYIRTSSNDSNPCGDVAFHFKGRPLKGCLFVRNNVFVKIIASDADGWAGLPQVAQALDRSIIEKFIGNTGLEVPDPQPIQSVSMSITSPTHKKSIPFDEQIENELKKLPESEARYRCLEEARKLTEAPDIEPDKLEFYMRGLGRSFDPPEVKVLRQILMMTKNEKLRIAAIRQLSKWIANDVESRQTVIKDLSQRLLDPNHQVRQDALRAVGQGGDIRQLKKIVPLLDDADEQVSETALKAVADLLGLKLPKPSDGAMLQRQLGQVKQAGELFLHTLEEAERLVAPQKPQ